MSRSVTKRNKTDVSKLKNYINNMKQREQQKNLDYEHNLLNPEKSATAAADHLKPEEEMKEAFEAADFNN